MFGNTAMWAGTTNTFGSSSFTSISSGTGGGNWQTTTSDTSSYIGASFGTVTTTTSALRWNGRSGGTPSSGTGLSSGYGGSGFYVYAETSSPAGRTTKTPPKIVFIMIFNGVFFFMYNLLINNDKYKTQKYGSSQMQQ